jgi:hypothetical protein
MSGAPESLSALVAWLALTVEEALAIFGLHALEAIAGDVEHRPEIAILDSLTAEAAEAFGEDALARWLRAGPPGARPLDLLLAGRFGDFEDTLAQRIALIG